MSGTAHPTQEPELVQLNYCTGSVIEPTNPFHPVIIIIIIENDRARLYWDRTIITDRTILANKPDIVLMDRAQSRIFLVDITIPYDENLVKAVTR